MELVIQNARTVMQLAVLYILPKECSNFSTIYLLKILALILNLTHHILCLMFTLEVIGIQAEISRPPLMLSLQLLNCHSRM